MVKISDKLKCPERSRFFEFSLKSCFLYQGSKPKQSCRRNKTNYRYLSSLRELLIFFSTEVYLNTSLPLILFLIRNLG